MEMFCRGDVLYCVLALPVKGSTGIVSAIQAEDLVIYCTIDHIYSSVNSAISSRVLYRCNLARCFTVLNHTHTAETYKKREVIYAH
jgi:hypothetical protein